MKILKLLGFICLLAIPGRSHAGCDAVYRDALVNYLRDKSSYTNYQYFYESLKTESRRAAQSGSGFNLSVVADGIPLGGGLSNSRTKELADMLEQQSTSVVSVGFRDDVTTLTGNRAMADSYNACKALEERGLRLDIVASNPESSQVTAAIKPPLFRAEITSVNFDRKAVKCSGAVPKRTPILIAGTLTLVCKRKDVGPAADVVVVTDAGPLAFQLPGNFVETADICKAPTQLTAVFYNFGEATMNVHKIPHDPGGGYYSKAAIAQIDTAAAAMKSAGFKPELYGSPMITLLKQRIQAAPTGTQNSAYNERTQIANEVISHARYLSDRVSASCPVKLPQERTARR